MKRKITLTLLFIATIFLLSGCFGAKSSTQEKQNPTTQNPTTTDNSIKVQIKDDGFYPPTITIKKGELVKWTNTGALAHTVSGDQISSGDMQPKGTFGYIFNQTGEFTYVCSYHNKMTGKVIVK